MSKPKTYHPYKVMRDGSDSWIVDAHGNDVITNVVMSDHYAVSYQSEIMDLICDAMNRREEEQ